VPLWQRVLRLTLVLASLGGVIAAVLFVELADITTRQQITDQNPQPESRQAGQHQELSSQIESVSHWLTEHKESIDIISVILVAIFTGTLLRLRHKFQKPSNEAAFEGLRDWLFCRKSTHVLGLRLVCDAVVLWGATKRLADLAKGQAVDMQKLLIAAQNNADAAALQAKNVAQQHTVLQEQARATVEAAKAARDSADALPTLERAYLHLFEIEPIGIKFHLNNLLATASSSQLIYPSARAAVKNYGKTPASFVAGQFDIDVAKGIPPQIIPRQ
jgi:hypothetical protein